MNAVAWLRDRIREAGAPSEGATDRDGAFSYKAESHAFGMGLYAGMTSSSLRPTSYPDHPDVSRERPYFALGFVVGDVTQAATIVAIAVAVVIAGTLYPREE